jgi:hypothetical protein
MPMWVLGGEGEGVYLEGAINHLFSVLEKIVLFICSSGVCVKQVISSSNMYHWHFLAVKANKVALSKETFYLFALDQLKINLLFSVVSFNEHYTWIAIFNCTFVPAVFLRT